MLVISDEPLKLVLIDAISVGTAELVDDSIQARFGGIGSPTTIKDANEIITHLSDLVTMQVHSRETSVISAHASVSVSPVLACLDGSVHELLDLTHDVVSEVYVMDWWFSGSNPSSISSTLKGTEQTLQVIGAVIISDEGAVTGTLKSSSESSDLRSGQLKGDHGRLR